MARERAPDFLGRDPKNPNASYFDAQQVCLNGDQVTARYHDRPQHRRDFCETCGAGTIYACQKCGAEIKGQYVVPTVGAPSGDTKVPSHCHACGEPFPWTIRRAAAITKSAEAHPDSVSMLELLAYRFHIVARQLRSRHGNRHTLDIEDEYDVQDLMHALLQLFFDDIRTEEWTPSYAGSSARMDFLLKEKSVVVETKKTGPRHGGREIGEELIIDIAKYREHSSCKKLFCFIYDPEEKIVNPRGLEKDLSRKEGNLDVQVMVTPRR